MKKIIAIIAAVVALTAVGLAIGLTSVFANQSVNSEEGARVVESLGPQKKMSLTGPGGTCLLVDVIGDSEYDEMMEILYPDGIVDEQGLSIPGVENLEEERAKFIAEHTKAYSLDGDKITEVDITPFNVKMSSGSDGEYESLFYKAVIDDDSFVFPSEWSPGNYDFAVSEKGVYLACSYTEILRIDPVALTAKKLSSDFYNGKSRVDIETEVRAGKTCPNKDIYWIDSPYLSPDGEYVIYRTNRDCPGYGDTSVWAVNLNTGEEFKVVEPALDNDIVGFLSDNHIVVGSSANTRVVDIVSGEVIPLSFPELPNFCIDGTGNGVIIYSGYPEDSSITTMYINNVDVLTGEISTITKVSGFITYEPGGPKFSPSGEQIAINYGIDPDRGTDNIVFVDLKNGEQKLFTESIQNTKHIKGNIGYFMWLPDDSCIVTAMDRDNNGKFDVCLIAADMR